MSNPACNTVDTRPSPVPPEPWDCSKALTTITRGGQPEYRLQDARASVPFCRVCRQTIWNRIGPLATLQARPRTPISVVARYPQHLDVFAVANNGRTMSNWWDVSSGWAGFFHVQGGIASPGGSGSPVTAISRYAGHLDLFTVGTDNRVFSCWWDAGSGWHPWFPIGNLHCRPGSTVNVVSQYTDHLELFTTASDGRVMSTWWHEGAGWGATGSRSWAALPLVAPR